MTDQERNAIIDDIISILQELEKESIKDEKQEVNPFSFLTSASN